MNARQLKEAMARNPEFRAMVEAETRLSAFQLPESNNADVRVISAGEAYVGGKKDGRPRPNGAVVVYDGDDEVFRLTIKSQAEMETAARAARKLADYLAQ